MPMNFDSALGMHADALRVRSQRSEMLASNLANADTPGFKARDIDFQAAMKMAQSNQSGGLNATHQKHFQTSPNDSASSAVKYRTVFQDSLDGNTVDAQIEQSQFMQNAVQYQASLEFLGGKFQGLTKALKGGN